MADELEELRVIMEQDGVETLTGKLAARCLVLLGHAQVREHGRLEEEIARLKARTAEAVELVRRLARAAGCRPTCATWKQPHPQTVCTCGSDEVRASADAWLATQGTAPPRSNTAETVREIVGWLDGRIDAEVDTNEYTGGRKHALESAREHIAATWGGETTAEPRVDHPLGDMWGPYVMRGMGDPYCMACGWTGTQAPETGRWCAVHFHRAPAPQARPPRGPGLMEEARRYLTCVECGKSLAAESAQAREHADTCDGSPECKHPSHRAAQAREAEPPRGELNRNEHSVIDVARRLVEGSTGTGDALPNREALATWLEWRVREGWAPSGLDVLKSYDAAVRAMATSALKLYREREQ